MKLTTTQLPHPSPMVYDRPAVIDTPTKILIYLTLLLTLSTNTIKSLTHLLTALKNLKNTIAPDRKNNPKICTGAPPAPKNHPNPS